MKYTFSHLYYNDGWNFEFDLLGIESNGEIDFLSLRFTIVSIANRLGSCMQEASHFDRKDHIICVL